MGNFQKRNWLVILNPHAGSGRGKKDQSVILKMLNKSDFKYELAISEFPKHTISITIQAIEKGYRNLIVAGGDVP